MSVFLADIGGTTSRLAFAGADGAVRAVRVIANDSVSGPEDAIAAAIEALSPRPRGAVLAIAGPVAGDEIRLTNRAWTLRLSALAKRCGFARIHAVNDFEAIAWSLPSLRDADLRPLGRAGVFLRAPKVVLGPGTGLGVAALVPVSESWHAVASEAGHSSFGAASDGEEAVFARVRREFPVMTAETILCGPGLPRLHRGLHPDATALSPEAIVEAALAGERAALETAALFVRLVGRFAGDMALTFRAAGGVYVAGGVAHALGPLLDAKVFRDAFEAHPPYEPLLRSMPSALITCSEPGLLGCAALARATMPELLG